jgi:hypothetical protein
VQAGDAAGPDWGVHVVAGPLGVCVGERGGD